MKNLFSGLLLILALGCGDSGTIAPEEKAKEQSKGNITVEPALPSTVSNTLGPFKIEELTREQWFGVYSDKKKVGFQKLWARKETVNGKPMLVVELGLDMALPTPEGARLRVRKLNHFELETPHGLVYALDSEEVKGTDGKSVINQIEARRTDNGMEIAVSEKGITQKHVVEGLAGSALEEFAVEAWLRKRGPVKGESHEMELTDLQKRKRVKRTATVERERTLRLLGKEVEVRVVKITDSDGKSTVVAYGPDDLTTVSMHLPDLGLVLRQETKEQALGRTGN